MTNIRKHANTTRVNLELGRLGTKIRLRIRDFGHGFEPAAPTGEAGSGEKVGLTSMQEQVALLGGEFKVESRAGVGTLVVADIPLVMPTAAAHQRRTGS